MARACSGGSGGISISASFHHNLARLGRLALAQASSWAASKMASQNATKVGGHRRQIIDGDQHPVLLGVQGRHDGGGQVADAEAIDQTAQLWPIPSGRDRGHRGWRPVPGRTVSISRFPASPERFQELALAWCSLTWITMRCWRGNSRSMTASSTADLPMPGGPVSSGCRPCVPRGRSVPPGLRGRSVR